MSSIEEIEKENKERLAKEKARNRIIATKKYHEEKEMLKKRSYSSFGKLILAKESSSPIYSFPGAKRIVYTKPKRNKGNRSKSSKEKPDLKTHVPLNQYDKFKYKIVSKNLFSLQNGV